SDVDDLEGEDRLRCLDAPGLQVFGVKWTWAEDERLKGGLDDLFGEQPRCIDRPAVAAQLTVGEVQTVWWIDHRQIAGITAEQTREGQDPFGGDVVATAGRADSSFGLNLGIASWCAHSLH